MKMRGKSSTQIAGVVILAITTLIIGFLIWRQWASQPVLISREEAIQHAIEACNPGYGLQPVEPPTEFETEVTTYEEALGFAPIPSKAQQPVYVVKLKKGKWLLVGGPAPDPASNPEPSYWDECTQIIDAETGEWLSTPIE